MSKVIDGIKLITHNMAGIHNPDDPSYPWRLDVRLRHAEFLEVAAVMKDPKGEIVCVRGKSRESLEEFAALNDLYNHPRLINIKIWRPEEEIYNE